jgi:hypothetical protein
MHGTAPPGQPFLNPQEFWSPPRERRQSGITPPLSPWGLDSAMIFTVPGRDDPETDISHDHTNSPDDTAVPTPNWMKRSYLLLFNGAIAGMHSVYRAAGNGLGYVADLGIPHAVTDILHHTYEWIKEPMQTARGLHLIGMFSSFTILVTNVAKLARTKKRLKTAMKAARAFGILVDSMVKTTMGIGALPLEFTQKGYPLAERSVKFILENSISLGVVSWFFSGAAIIVDSISLKEIQKTKNWLTIDDHQRTAEVKQEEFFLRLGLANPFIQSKYGQINVLNKFKKLFLFNTHALNAKLQNEMRLNNGSVVNKGGLIDNLMRRTDSVILSRRIQVIVDLGSILSTLFIITNFLYPLGIILAGTTLVTTALNSVYKQITTYQLEDRLGLIERKPDDPFSTLPSNQITIAMRVMDFFKWLFKIHSYVKIEVSDVVRDIDENAATAGSKHLATEEELSLVPTEEELFPVVIEQELLSVVAEEKQPSQYFVFSEELAHKLQRINDDEEGDILERTSLFSSLGFPRNTDN